MKREKIALKYLIAGGVAGLLILCMLSLIWVVKHEFYKEMRDPGGECMEDYGMEVPGGTLIWLALANLLETYQVLLSILILCTGLGMVFFCESSGKSAEPEDAAVSAEQ